MAAAASFEPSSYEDQASPDQPAAFRSFSLISFDAPAAVQTIEVSVSLSRASAELVTLQLQTVDRTALAGVDYRLLSGTLQFQPGATDKFVTIELLFFALPADTFSAASSSDGDFLVYSASLSDGSPLPAWLQFDPQTLSFSGTPPASALGSLAITITATDSAKSQATATFALMLAANDGFASFTISGAPTVGNTLTATNSSPDPDGNGVFSYSWQASSNGTSWSPVGTNSSSYLVASADYAKRLRLVVSYTDGQSFSETVTTFAGEVPLPPSITLAVSPVSIVEDGSTNLVVSFSRTGSTAGELTVTYTVAGSASLATDYTGMAASPATKTISIAAGSATATLTVDHTANTTIEADETVEITLVAGTGYTIGSTAAVIGTILNDDDYIAGPTTGSGVNLGSTNGGYAIRNGSVTPLQVT